MSVSKKIAISLPEEVLSAMEKVRRRTGESRSAFIRRALEQALAERKERAQISRYLEGYRRHPETRKEVKAAEAAATALLAEEPWE
jgi:metal-responsive CopG/Arc/MetJ family transcriptional regulator